MYLLQKIPFFPGRNPRLKSLNRADLSPQFTPIPTRAQVIGSNTRQRVGRSIRQHSAAQWHWLSLNHRKKLEKASSGCQSPDIGASSRGHRRNRNAPRWDRPMFCWFLSHELESGLGCGDYRKVDARVQSQETCRSFRQGKGLHSQSPLR